MGQSQMRTAAYCRVSTNKAEQLDSYGAQQEFFKDYCQRHGFNLLRIYGDEGKSGTKIKNRKQLLELLSDAEQGLYDIVLIKDRSSPLSPKVFPVIKPLVTGFPSSYHFRYTSK